MANHLTPEELSKEVGIEREEVIRICLEEHVPIYQGKIDKTLFQAQLHGDRTRCPAQALRPTARAADASAARGGGAQPVRRPLRSLRPSRRGSS